MNKVILQPSGNKDAREHFLDTIETNVNLTRIGPHISVNDFQVLQDIYPSGSCKVWGVTPGGSNQTKWSRIETGDITLFSREGSIYASAVTTYKLHCHSLAAELWNYNADGQTWEYIYFLDELRGLSISYATFNDAVGYKPSYIIQGFSVLDASKSAAVIQAFDLQSSVFYADISKDECLEAISYLTSLNETEAEIQSSRRLEQGYLQKHLFGRKTVGTCAGCNRDYPVSFLVTAHIKRRSQCTLEERIDHHVVMPLCSMGCDQMFEKGYVSVLDGVYVDMKKTPSSHHLQKCIDQLAGKLCTYYNDATRPYFEWHYDYSR
ncbi:HNH endonuclease [Synechococcus sp. BSF8S]|uniref:HNH endonuclease n=1 Tax=Synechococcales TaxID=1890424 RepID=UPI0016260273|nr:MULTISPECIES: HNH endonuclease [unclassified Synechococcus]MBC1262487.1 HNH endonuclease [Synechococcus sp. BSF8S]MBC1265370.1 HNH endonuclease [Synechococcus sp. BSA11S]